MTTTSMPSRHRKYSHSASLSLYGFYEKMAMFCITQSPSLMLMEKCWCLSKTHIPDDHYYQEMIHAWCNTISVCGTLLAKIGIGICWDQWFPETARCLRWMGQNCSLSNSHRFRANSGYRQLWALATYHARPRSSKILSQSLQPIAMAWRSLQEENGGQSSSSLTSYGSSFMTDETGAGSRESWKTRRSCSVSNLWPWYGWPNASNPDCFWDRKTRNVPTNYGLEGKFHNKLLIFSRLSYKNVR